MIELIGQKILAIVYNDGIDTHTLNTSDKVDVSNPSKIILNNPFIMVVEAGNVDITVNGIDICQLAINQEGV